MPSLRRTLSSPAVRASPYSTPSSSSANQAARSQGGHGPRRSLGSETGGRRVLADIDWWTVHADQLFTAGYAPPAQIQDAEDDPQTEQELPLSSVNGAQGPSTENAVVPVALWHTVLPGSGAGALDSESVQAPFALGASFDEPLSPLAHIAALSISHRTPGQRRDTVSSDSSLESSPVSTISSLSPMLNLGLSDIVAPHAATFDLEPVPLNISSPSRSRHGTMATRSISYSFFETARENEQRFDDIPCFPAESFSCTVADIDDLFYQ